MKPEIAKSIIGKISEISEIQCAVCDEFGVVIASTEKFSLAHATLEIKSKRSMCLKYGDKNYGYLYLDEPLSTISGSGKMLKSMANIIIGQHVAKDALTSNEKRIDQIFYDYLNTDLLRTDEFINILTSFNIDPTLNRSAIFIEIEEPDYLQFYEKEILLGEREKKIARIKNSLRSVFDSFFTHHKKNIFLYLGRGNFLVLKDMGKDAEFYQNEFKKNLNSLHYDIKKELRTPVTIGVSSFTAGALGLKESYQEAKTANSFGKQIWGPDKIFHFDSFGVVAPLYTGINNENIVITKHILEKISEQKELRKTLEIYLDKNLSLTETAKILKIHRNTLIYRLDKIAQLTNLDPRIFNDAFQLQMALYMEKYNALS